jgi:NADP-dependent 3-hydroxy acid dehydrogenase YdfG
MIDTNISGLIHTTVEVLPLLREAGRGASIINVGSVAHRWAYPGGNVYGATKAFVHQFSHNLRTDLAGSDIRVTTLEPGMAKSEFTLVRTHGDAEANEKFYEGVEPILPENIADIVWFLANQPPHINISILEVTPVAQVPTRSTIIRK